MAVQAQYPSNILLLNRNGQDGHDYSLQPQPGGGGGAAAAGVGFLDQSSHMIFHNGGPVSRKRGREPVSVHGGATPPAITNNNQSFSIQSSQQPSQPQLIELSQLHRAATPNNISTGLRLSFSDHHHPPPQLHHQNNLGASQSHSVLSSMLSEDFASHVKRHREELDQFLLSQSEELRRTLAEKRQRQYRALVGAAEEGLGRRLREKEAEVEKAARRNAELEARAAQLSVEAQVWQAKARSQEVAAASLQVQLHQAIVAAPPDIAGEAEDAESAYVDPDRVTAVSSGPGACRSCGRRVARVVVLPCRHLCLCTECDLVAEACPVCLHLRNSSVEVFLC